MVDVTIMYHWVIAGTLMDEGYRRIGCTVVPGGIGMVPVHLDNFKWLGVTGLFAFPTFLEELAHGAEEHGVDPARDLKLRICTIAGEMRSDALRQRMEEFWGGLAVREIYGGAEIPFIAADCEAGAGMHLNPDFIVELLHPETREPVEWGEPGVVVATELERVAEPMIRYWTGDIVAGLDPGAVCVRADHAEDGSCARPGRGDPSGEGAVPRAQADRGRAGASGGKRPLPGRHRPARPAGHRASPRRARGLSARARRRARARVVAAVKEATRLTCEVELVETGALGDAGLIDDRRSF